MIRFFPLLIVLAAFLVGANASKAQTGSKNNRYNVLFIAVDDLRTELGCYDLPYVQSPNLDRLAKQSVLFKNHFVQVPTCGASRYALLTGRSPASSGVRGGNASLHSGKSKIQDKVLPGAQSMPELFRRAGYHTVLIGKISHTADGLVYAYNGKGDGHHEIPNAWDDYATPYGSWKRGWGTFFAYEGGRHREDGKGNRDLYEFKAEKDEDLPDGLMAQKAIEKLAELKKQDQPFFMGLGFFKPHLPFVATRGDWEAIDKGDIPAPRFGEKVASPYWHGSGEFYKYKAPHKKTKPLAVDDQIKMRKAYLACVRYVDRQIGKVLKQLEELDMADNTIVVIWGDHGWHLGESAIWGKHSPWERALNSTLMIRAPGISKAGLRSNALVETTDLYPTLVDLCQTSFAKTQHPLDGKSLRHVLNGSRQTHRQHAISYWNKAVSVRTADRRMIARQKEDGFEHVELYDIQKSKDPGKNLAELEPKQVEQLKEAIREFHRSKKEKTSN